MEWIRFPEFSTLPNKVCNVKFGIDPTSDMLHLGHLIPLKMVKKLKAMGHNIHIVLGTFTAQMGDPSGKDSMRPILDAATTKRNAESIINQLERILGDGFKIHFNHTWFEKMSMVEMMNIVSKFTVSHLLSRDSFQKRFENNDSIGLHELLVPILQGIDSVELKADVEIGGTDQLFNFSITRDVQKHFGLEQEMCFMSGVINGTDGRKMSKSFNNCIYINDSPNDVFGKTMSISDETMEEWIPFFFDNGLDVESPMKRKKALAFKVTAEIWGEDEATNAHLYFENVIQSKKLPDEVKNVTGRNMIHVIAEIRNCSNKEAKRLLQSNSVKVNDLVTINESHLLSAGDIVKVGKRDFGKIV